MNGRLESIIGPVDLTPGISALASWGSGPGAQFGTWGPEQNAAFNELSVANDPNLRDQMYDRAGPGVTFPQIYINGVHIGRSELRGGGNFNRQWPDMFQGLVEMVESKLGPDAERNVTVIREAMGRKLASMRADFTWHCNPAMAT